MAVMRKKIPKKIITPKTRRRRVLKRAISSLRPRKRRGIIRAVKRGIRGGIRRLSTGKG